MTGEVFDNPTGWVRVGKRRRALIAVGHLRVFFRRVRDAGRRRRPGRRAARALGRRAMTELLLGTKKGLEARVVPADGFAIEWLSMSGLRGIAPPFRRVIVTSLPPSSTTGSLLVVSDMRNTYLL